MLYNKCWSKELEEQYGDKDRAKALPSFKEFEDKALNVLNDQPIKKIIFDMRFNGGGKFIARCGLYRKIGKILKGEPQSKDICSFR